MSEFPVAVEPAQDLTPEERAVEQRAIENLNCNLPRLVEEYRNKYGAEIGTDNARDIVSADYAESLEAATRWSRAVQRPAAALANHLFDEALRNPDASRHPFVVMMAGGTGAGKTTALRNLPALARRAQFVYDSNLNSKKSSVEKIEAALAAGNEVRILYVLRDPVEALVNGVLPRAMEEGRVVELQAHARMYRDSAENLKYLAKRYRADPRVQITIWDNSRGLEGGEQLPVEFITQIRYSTSELLPKLRAALEVEYGKGRISEAVYRATLGARSEGASGSLACDSGRSAAGAGSAGAAQQDSCGNAGPGTG